MTTALTSAELQVGQGALSPAADHTLVDRLATVADVHPERPALIDRNGSVLTYGDLWTQALGQAATVREPGPSWSPRPSGSPVVLALPVGATALVALVGVLASGRPALCLDPAAPVGLVRSLARRSAAGGAVVADGDEWDVPGVPVCRPAPNGTDRPVAPRPRPAATALLAGRHADDGAVLLVAYTHAALLTAAEEVALALALGPASSIAPTAGPWTEASLLAWLAPLVAGATIDLRPPGAAPVGDSSARPVLVGSPPLARALAAGGDRPTIATIVFPPTGHDPEPVAPGVAQVVSALRDAARPVEPAPRAAPSSWADRAIGTLLDLDDRLVSRDHPRPRRTIPVGDLAWAAPLTAQWATVRSELDALLERGVQLPSTDDVNGEPQGAEGPWTTYVLHAFGHWVEPNARRCPATAALVAAVPDLEIAGFTVLGGRTHLPRHRGPMRSIRYQLGVRIPPGPGESGLRVGDEVVRWADAGSTAFDDRTEHEAWNDADEPRYVLFVQTSWPSRGLTGRLHRALRRGLWRLGGVDLAARAASLDTALNGT